MGKFILVTGGARSGKSTFAEKLTADIGQKVLYIATAIAFDEEMQDRIKKHKESRPKEWDTFEGYKGLGQILESKGSSYNAILLDCVTVMLTNLLFDYPGMDFDKPSFKVLKEAEAYVTAEFDKLIAAALEGQATVVLVTNELGSGLVPENEISRAFRDIAGRINQRIAAKCHEVYLTVCGIPMKIK